MMRRTGALGFSNYGSDGWRQVVEGNALSVRGSASVTSFENYLAIFANESVLPPNVRFFCDHGVWRLLVAAFKCPLAPEILIRGGFEPTSVRLIDATHELDAVSDWRWAD